MKKIINSRSPGAVYVEFLIVIIPFLILALCTVQIALMYGAQLLVEASAHMAVRAAVVIMPDDEGFYRGGGINEVGPGSGLHAYEKAPAGSRISMIRRAAAIPLLPVSVGIRDLKGLLTGRFSLADAFRRQGAVSMLARLNLDLMPVAVTFPDTSGGYRTKLGPASKITARVTYLFTCRVPVAADIMCSGYFKLPYMARKELATSTSRIMTYAVSPAKFAVLSAQRSMRNQGTKS